jgi:hypothetical protein
MAYVPNILKKGYAPAFKPKTADRQYEFQTMDGREYIVYVPTSMQGEAYTKSLKKYKDVFEQIKVDIKDNAAIAKNKDGLPNNLDHVEWAALLSSTLKKLDKTWGINQKIWIRNKKDDDTKTEQPFLAITPKITQRNAKRAARKVSAAKVATADDNDGYIDPDDIEFGPLINVPVMYVKNKNGLTYYYHTEEDARNNKYFKIENSDEELVNESGKRINPDGTLMKFIRKSDFDKRQERKRSKRAWAEKQIEQGNDLWLDDYDTSREPSEGFITEDEAEDEYESDSERDDYDYNDGIPPYEGAMWDDDIKVWVSNPIDPEIYDEEGNYKIPPEDIVVEPAPTPAPAPVQQQESRRDKIKRLMREKVRASMTKKPEPVVVMPPPAPMPAPAPTPAPPTEDPRIVEARIGLPPGWQPLISKTNNIVYYYNQNTGNKQYERPTEDPRIVEASIGLPAGWIPLISRSTNRVYYYNQTTGNKQFERPTMGGKRTRRRTKAKSRAKKSKRQQTTTRRKRTTRRRK